MSSFSASGVSGALTTTLKTVLGIRQPASPLDRFQVYTMVIGSSDTPADVAIHWQAQRTSTAGTSTSVTASDVQDGAQVSSAVVGQTYTAEPTVVSNSILFDQGLNLRSIYTLVMAPNTEWVVTTTATRGLCVGAFHASSTATVRSSLYWYE